MPNGLLISANGRISIVPFSEDNLLSILFHCVNGAFQFVPLNESYSIWINESGKINNLEPNPIATSIWQYFFITNDILHGNVFFTGGCADDGTSLGLEADQIDFLKNSCRN